MRAYLLLSSVLVLGCSDRALPVDGGSRPDLPRPPGDLAPGADRALPRPEWGGRIDGCKRPAGFCYYKSDCLTGQECIGCYPDPCCPACGVCMGKCTGATGCKSNLDCTSSEFCNLDLKCSAPGSSGQCQPRPNSCPEIYSPVCGCDDKTYGNDCEAHAAGMSVAAKGKCCKELNADYMALVLSAKKCCALCGSIDTCTLIVNNQLACPCPTVVNATAAEVAELKALAQQWSSQACTVVGCPPVACAKVIGGSCQPSSTGPGQCADQITPP